MIGRGLAAWRKARRRLDQMLNHNALILLYHRVAELPSDPWSLAVSPRHFAEHLAILQQFTRPLRLRQLLPALQTNRLPERSVVVTFDDGYADNLHNAKPLLEQYGIPTTIFITSGAIGKQQEYWWDQLDKVFLQPGSLPARLQLEINGVTHAWELGEAAFYSTDDARRFRCWRALRDTPPSPRHAIYLAVWQLLHAVPTAERDRALRSLLAWAGADPRSRPTHRTLDQHEVVTLAAGDQIEIGAHTVTHTALSALTIAGQRDEIQRSKAQLEELVDRPVTTFTYPYGKRSDYTSQTVAMVRAAGFACACSNMNGGIGRSVDPFQLPRLYVNDWDGDTFARRLSEWLRVKIP